MQKKRLRLVLVKLFRQASVPGIGALKDVYGATSYYFSIMSLVMMAMTAFHTTIQPFLFDRGIALYLPTFMIIVGVMIVATMLLEYKFVYHSFYAFKNKQAYEHQNLLKEDIARVNSLITEIEDRIARLEK